MCDPIDDPELYIRLAQENSLNVRYVIDTHLHADHVSGGRRLAEISGAEYVLHESADTQYPFRHLRDGEVLDLGNVQIQALHTPGHTPEHLSLLITDKTRGPELASQPEIGARQLFGTIQRLKELPDYLEILPGAYAGSVCGRALSGKAISTIGFERRFNRAFQINALEQFVAFMLESIPAPPPNAAAVRALNQGRTD